MIWTLLLAATLGQGESKKAAKAKAEPKREANHAALAADAGRILDRYCHRCHRGSGSSSGFAFDVHQPKTLVQGEEGVVVVGKSKESPIWQRAFRGAMPPKNQPQLPKPSAEDVDTIARWIDAGAPAYPAIEPRPFLTLTRTLELIEGHLRKLPDTRSRQRYRYFTITALYNNAEVTEPQLTLAKAAFVKTLNSLSWERELAQPTALDKEGTVFAVDISSLGWTTEHWRDLRAAYPYGLGLANLADAQLRELEQRVDDLARDREPLRIVRGDWFIATATQPTLYYKLLYDRSLLELRERAADGPVDNPTRMTALDLERHLGVDVHRNLDRAERVVRAGFTVSGVSGQNRLVERHPSKYGAYWKSYDFKAANGRAILTQFPNGPVRGGKDDPLAFVHDGGEIIFHLPNGQQGYLLVDGKDNRIDAGPIEVVSDALKTSGTPLIVAGLSCIACHAKGMIVPPDDEVRAAASVFGAQRERVERIYVPKDEFNDKVDRDRKQFLESLERLAGPILQTGRDAERDIGDFPEPVGETARLHLLEELSLATVAAELHEKDTAQLKTKIENTQLLADLGLRVLLRENGRIKRAFWESKQGAHSVMQLTASTLDFAPQSFGR